MPTMFHEIRQPPPRPSDTSAPLNSEALAALPLHEQVAILRRDLAEMWRAHHHNAHVIHLLTLENERLRNAVADLSQ